MAAALGAAALAQSLRTLTLAHVDPLMAHLPLAYPLSVGRVSSGDWASSVPDLLVAEGRHDEANHEAPPVRKQVPKGLKISRRRAVRSRANAS